MTSQRLRLAAYAVCVQDDRLLLARYVSPDGTQRHWTLPGGRVEHGEDPFDAVVREVVEETGYLVEVERLLGVDSRSHQVHWGGPGGAHLHRVGVLYEVRIRAGELRNETTGSTDLAAWVAISDIAKMERTVTVDVALEMHRTRPPHGHVGHVAIGGLLRH